MGERKPLLTKFAVEHRPSQYLNDSILELHCSDNDTRYRLTEQAFWCKRDGNFWIVLKQLETPLPDNSFTDEQIIRMIDKVRGFMLAKKTVLIKGQAFVGTRKRGLFKTPASMQVKIFRAKHDRLGQIRREQVQAYWQNPLPE